MTISVILERDDGVFCSDWRKGAVFSQLISGGNRSPEPVEGNAEGAELPHGYVAEKTNPGASELRKSPSSLKNRRYAKLPTARRMNLTGLVALCGNFYSCNELNSKS